ncbi:MAG: N-acetyl-alpha-D-glucosaminyl L-malate synthase BshA [Candidatus Woesearchaeota archaeon]
MIPEKEKLTIVKVLYARPHIGGSGRVGIETALELARRGHDVHIVSYPDTYLEDEEKDLLTLHALDDISYGCFKVNPIGVTFPSKIHQLANELKIDVLHAHYAITHGEAVIDARDSIRRDIRRGKLPHYSRDPVAVITCHGSDITVNGYKNIIAPNLELKLSQADEITFVSQSLQDEARRILDLDDYGKVIYNFVDENKFRRDESGKTRLKVRNEWGIPPDALVYYHVSNFRPVKNTAMLIDAMHSLTSDGCNDHVRLLLIGDGPDRMCVEEKVIQYGLQDKVIFTGQVSPEKVPSYSQAGDVLLLPSIKESFGLVNLEAMHLGNACIASRVGGIPEVLFHNVSGYMFDPASTEELVHHMRKFAKDPLRSRFMGAQGRKIANKRFNRSSIADMYECTYHDTLARANDHSVYRELPLQRQFG